MGCRRCADAKPVPGKEQHQKGLCDSFSPASAGAPQMWQHRTAPPCSCPPWPLPQPRLIPAVRRFVCSRHQHGCKVSAGSSTTAVLSPLTGAIHQKKNKADCVLHLLSRRLGALTTHEKEGRGRDGTEYKSRDPGDKRQPPREEAQRERRVPGRGQQDGAADESIPRRGQAGGGSRDLQLSAPSPFPAEELSTPRSRRSRARPHGERPGGLRARPRQHRARATPRSPGPARRCRRSPGGGSTAPRRGGGGGRRGIRGPAAPPAAGGRRRRPAGSDGSAARPGPAWGAHPPRAPRGSAVAVALPGGASQAPAAAPSRRGANPARSRAGPRRCRPPAPLPP